MLTKLPLILASLIFTWKTLSTTKINSTWSIKSIKRMRDKIIEFVSSLTKSNSISFIRAIGQCWGQYKQQQKLSTTKKDHANELQAIIDILMNINNYPINDIIYSMNIVLRNLSITNNKVRKIQEEILLFCLYILLLEKTELYDFVSSTSLELSGTRKTNID